MVDTTKHDHHYFILHNKSERHGGNTVADASVYV